MSRTAALLLALCLLSGCATRTWTEQTNTTRQAGPAQTNIENRKVINEYFELTTDKEKDGFVIDRRRISDEEGQIHIGLLGPALQCLYYKHDVTLTLRSEEEDKVVYTRKLTETESRNTIRDLSVQAKLGQQVPLHRKSADLLDKLVNSTPEPELRAELDAIRVKLKILESWE